MRKNETPMDLNLVLTLPRSELSRNQLLRRQRYRMWKENPACHWCGRETIFVENPHLQKNLKDNTCTIDHLHSRLQPDLRRSGYNRHFLACWKCNNDRARAEDKTLPLEEKRRRAGRYPELIQATKAFSEYCRSNGLGFVNAERLETLFADFKLYYREKLDKAKLIQ